MGVGGVGSAGSLPGKAERGLHGFAEGCVDSQRLAWIRRGPSRNLLGTSMDLLETRPGGWDAGTGGADRAWIEVYLRSAVISTAPLVQRSASVA